MHIRKDDVVQIVAGEDKGTKDDPTRGRVLRVVRAEGRITKVIVEGVNRVYRHVRRSQRNPQGGRLSKEMPIAVSNVQLVCTACGRAARTGARFKPDGSKERYCKRCKAGIGGLKPPKSKKAQAKTA